MVIALCSLGKTLYSHSAFLLVTVYMGSGEHNAGSNPVTDLCSISSRMRVEIFLDT